MRAKMAAIRVCRAVDRIRLTALGVVGMARKPANWSARGDLFVIAGILSGGLADGKKNFAID